MPLVNWMCLAFVDRSLTVKMENELDRKAIPKSKLIMRKCAFGPLRQDTEREGGSGLSRAAHRSGPLQGRIVITMRSTQEGAGGRGAEEPRAVDVDRKALPGGGQSHLLIQDVLRDLQGRPGLRVVDDCDGGSGPGQQLEEKVVHERQCHGGGVVRLVVE